jgi:hypothetical protein
MTPACVSARERVRCTLRKERASDWPWNAKMETTSLDADLQAFLYVSLPTQAPELAILDIIRAAERVNSRMAVSGMLLYGPAFYAQLIEGPDRGVSRVRHRIAQDGRHRILWYTDWPVPRRSIGAALPMGYVSDREFPAGQPGVDTALASPTRPTSTALKALAQSLAMAAHHKYPEAARLQ